jgi:hypothetical protein
MLYMASVSNVYGLVLILSHTNSARVWTFFVCSNQFFFLASYLRAIYFIFLCRQLCGSSSYFVANITTCLGLGTSYQEWKKVFLFWRLSLAHPSRLRFFRSAFHDVIIWSASQQSCPHFLPSTEWQDANCHVIRATRRSSHHQTRPVSNAMFYCCLCSCQLLVPLRKSATQDASATYVRVQQDITVRDLSWLLDHSTIHSVRLDCD